MNSGTSSSAKRILFVIGAALFAGISGLAGAAVVTNYLSATAPSVTPGVVTLPVRSVSKADASKVSASAVSSVAFYKKRVGTGVLDKIFLPSEAVGAGAVLTADGWLVTSSSVLAAHDQLEAVFSDQTVATIDLSKIVRDEATGLAYVKAETQHRDVATFGDDAALQPADAVFSVSPNAVIAATVITARALPTVVRTDYVESTEKLARRIVMSRSGLSGAPVVDASGAVIGIDLGEGLSVPASFFVKTLRSVFTDGKVVRPVMGARYVGLDNLPNAKNAGLSASGALVTGGGKYRVTEKGSAAEISGLREGDVITMIERDRINNEVTLAERLQDYLPGAKVELTLLRAGKQVKASLTLKTNVK